MLPGDTFSDGTVKYTMTSMNVPEPVMSLAVSPVSKDSGGQVRHANWQSLLVVHTLLSTDLLNLIVCVFLSFQKL